MGLGLMTCGEVKAFRVFPFFSAGENAQTCHDDRVVELKEQLGTEEEDGERQEAKVKEEGKSRVKENAPWT